MFPSSTGGRYRAASRRSAPATAVDRLRSGEPGKEDRRTPPRSRCACTNDRAVDELADHYVERHASLDPIAATMEGIAGHDTEMTDYSPDAAEERAELDRATLRALAALTPGDGSGAASRPR